MKMKKLMSRVAQSTVVGATLLMLGTPAHAEYPTIVTKDTLLDRVQIEDLLQNFMWIIEAPGGAEGILDLFSEDGALVMNGLGLKGKSSIRDFIKKQAAGGPPPIKGAFHLILNNYKIVINGNTATNVGIWTGVLSENPKTPPKVMEQGRYNDEFVKIDGRWYFKKREVTSDSGTPPPPPPPAGNKAEKK